MDIKFTYIGAMAENHYQGVDYRPTSALKIPVNFFHPVLDRPLPNATGMSETLGVRTSHLAGPDRWDLNMKRSVPEIPHLYVKSRLNKRSALFFEGAHFPDGSRSELNLGSNSFLVAVQKRFDEGFGSRDRSGASIKEPIKRPRNSIG